MNSIVKYVQENFVQENSVEWILQSGGRGDYGFITLIFYSNGHPIVVGKVSRGNDQILRREYKNLKTVKTLLNKCDLNETIPRALAFVSLDGNHVLFEDYKSGVPGSTYLRTIFRKKHLKKFLRGSIGWLINFLRNTKKYHTSSETVKREAIRMWINSKKPNEYVKKWLKEKEFFAAPTHGDLIVSNIFVGEDGQVTGVLDFENFTINGFPIANLMDIIVSTGTTLFGYTQNMINKTFFESNWVAEEFKKCVKYFSEACEFETKDLIQVLPIYSDRAIYYSKKWGGEKLFRFHALLKRTLIERRDEIIWAK